MLNIIFFPRKFPLVPTLLVGFIFCLGGNAFAQTRTANPNQGDSPQSNEVNDNQLPPSLNPIDFIHNQNLRRSRDGSQFSTDTEKNLESAAEQFKRLQLQRLQDGQPTQPSPTPGPVN